MIYLLALSKRETSADYFPRMHIFAIMFSRSPSHHSTRTLVRMQQLFHVLGINQFRRQMRNIRRKSITHRPKFKCRWQRIKVEWSGCVIIDCVGPELCPINTRRWQFAWNWHRNLKIFDTQKPQAEEENIESFSLDEVFSSPCTKRRKLCFTRTRKVFLLFSKSIGKDATLN